MQDFPTKVDNISTEPASEYNNLTSELKRVLSSLGLAFNPAVVNQLAQSISIYSLIGKGYTDGGAADAYVLTASPATREIPDQYYTNMEVYFLPAFTNTTASTVNVSGLGVKSIVQKDGASALTAGLLTAGEYERLIYDGTNFRLASVDLTDATTTVKGVASFNAADFDVTAGAVSLDPSSANLGDLVQTVNTSDGALASGTTNIPVDDSIPQNTEGDQYMSLAITPTSASNKLIIEADLQFGASSDGQPIVIALFQDSIANAIAATMQSPRYQTTIGMTTFRVRWVMTAGTTSATIFKIRAGLESSGTLYFNGDSTPRRLFGGVSASVMTIQEVK